MPRTRRSFVALTILLVLSGALACTSYKGMETRPTLKPDGDQAEGSKLVKVERLELFGFTVNETGEQVYTEAELDELNKQAVKQAEAKAAIKEALFNIERKESREQVKEDTAKYLSWLCFLMAVGAVVVGVITEGYKKWGTMAACLFASGMVALLVPELLVYLKWVLIGLGAVGIVLGMSHTREWSLFNRKRNNTDENGKGFTDGREQPSKRGPV